MSTANHLLIFGGGSEIAIETSLILLNKGWSITLVNRNVIDNNIINQYKSSNNLEIITGIDFGNIDCSLENIEAIISKNLYTHILIAQGYLLDPMYSNSREIIKAYNCNIVSVALILNLIHKNNNSKIKNLTIIGSIAGDRGKEKNPVYDSTKGGLEILCQGFYQRFRRKNIKLTIIKPGNINTKIHNKNVKKNFLFTSAKRVAKDIVKSFSINNNVMYSPWYWGLIMFVIRKLPESIFFRLGIGRIN